VLQDSKYVISRCHSLTHSLLDSVVREAAAAAASACVLFGVNPSLGAAWEPLRLVSFSEWVCDGFSSCFPR
jgi:hypothetical protein